LKVTSQVSTIEHQKGSKMRRITKENAIDRPSLRIVQTLAFLENEAFSGQDVKVTHLGGSTMHQLVASSLLMDPEINHVRHIARVLTASAQNLLGVLCSSSIIQAISQRVLFFLSTMPFWGGVYELEN
jgi:hypothetical protein